MLKGIIDFSLKNKFIVLLATVAMVLGGLYSVRNIPLDAIPDLSDVQVIIYTEWPGQAPQIVQDQVTYPITTKMLSVPKAKVVRGYSFYGFSFVYVIFEDGTDPYWARTRVLEYLSGMSGRLPAGVAPTLGPDATGVGWAFMYSINATNRSLAELRSIQDWYLRYQLASVEGVVRQVPGTTSVFAERVMGGNYVEFNIDRDAIARYGLRVADVQDVLEVALGGMPLTTTVEGLERYTVNLRYSRDFRENLEALREIIVPTSTGAQVPLGQLAKIETVHAPMGIKSEAAVPNAAMERSRL